MCLECRGMLGSIVNLEVIIIEVIFKATKLGESLR